MVASLVNLLHLCVGKDCQFGLSLFSTKKNCQFGLFSKKRWKPNHEAFSTVGKSNVQVSYERNTAESYTNSKMW